MGYTSTSVHGAQSPQRTLTNTQVCLSALFGIQVKGLVTNYGEGGLQKGRGWHVKFYPFEKGGGGKSFIHAEGGAQKDLGYFLHGSLKF